MKVSFIILGFLLVMVGGYLWFDAQPPPGVEVMSSGAEKQQWIGLLTAVVGLISSAISLIAAFQK